MLRSELYAVAALSGTVLVVVGQLLAVPLTAAAIVGAAFRCWVRPGAMRRGWHLPVERQRELATMARHAPGALDEG